MSEECEEWRVNSELTPNVSVSEIHSSFALTTFSLPLTHRSLCYLSLFFNWNLMSSWMNSRMKFHFGNLLKRVWGGGRERKGKMNASFQLRSQVNHQAGNGIQHTTFLSCQKFTLIRWITWQSVTCFSCILFYSILFCPTVHFVCIRVIELSLQNLPSALQQHVYIIMQAHPNTYTAASREREREREIQTVPKNQQTQASALNLKLLPFILLNKTYCTHLLVQESDFISQLKCEKSEREREREREITTLRRRTLWQLCRQLQMQW